MGQAIEVFVDQASLVKVRQRLRDAGNGTLIRDLNKALRSAVVPIKEAEQRAARSLPATGVVHTGLRQQIADATTVRIISSKTAPGVVVYVPQGKVRGKLGADTNRARGWRHPVFGNKNNWVHQVMAPGWWNKAGQPGMKAAQQKCADALNAVAQTITKGL